MQVVLIVLIVLALAFGLVVLRGAPYLPTLTPQAEAALELLALRPGQTLLELGSGDGKVLVLAAQKGLHVVGVELNPLLVAFSWLRTLRYRKQVRVVWGDFWRTDWPQCDGVFAFLLPRYMGKLDARMRQLHKSLVSFAFKVPGRTADAEHAGVYLYKY